VRSWRLVWDVMQVSATVIVWLAVAMVVIADRDLRRLERERQRKGEQ
jgi:hypothetical protein